MPVLCLKKWLAFLSKPFLRFSLLILSGVTLLGTFLFVYRINPEKNPFVPACSFYYFTGLYCPGCGMTRALHAVLHCRFGEAFSYNAIWPVIAMFIAVVLYIWFYYLSKGKNPFPPINRFLERCPSAGWIFAAVLFVFWIARNIPLFPFTLLAPN